MVLLVWGWLNVNSYRHLILPPTPSSCHVTHPLSTQICHPWHWLQSWFRWYDWERKQRTRCEPHANRKFSWQQHQSWPHSRLIIRIIHWNSSLVTSASEGKSQAIHPSQLSEWSKELGKMLPFLAGFMLALRKNDKAFIKSMGLILSLEIPAVFSTMCICWLVHTSCF